ncbi:hypothetical protein [Methylobacterium tardum]|nr:hypothetical protein [Methylobacterium tardum]
MITVEVTMDATFLGMILHRREARCPKFENNGYEGSPLCPR